MGFKTEPIKARDYRYQYLATFLVNLTAGIFGVVIGWTGGNLLLLESENTPLASGPITADEKSWICSLQAFGAIASVLIFGFLSERFGRKKSILLIGVPQTLAWVCMAFATNVEHIYWSRILSGLAGGGVFIVVPVYITEIADKRIRGKLCASFSVVCNLGILIQFLLAQYVNFNIASILIAVVSIGFMIGFTFMPDSPQFFISKNRIDDAEKAFKFLRNIDDEEKLTEEYQTEFNSLKVIAKTEHLVESKTASSNSSKSIIIAFVVTHFPLFSGCFVLITYNQLIFESAGTNFLSPFWSSIIFAIIQLIGSCATSQLVDRTGRRSLLISSSFSSAFCLAIFGAFLFLKASGFDITNYAWVPIVSLSVEVFVSSVGIIPVPNIVAPEILNQKTRGPVMTIASLWTWVVGFLIIKFYPSVELIIGMHSVMWIFSVLCVFCGLFTLFFLPETKGKSIENIADAIDTKSSNKN